MNVFLIQVWKSCHVGNTGHPKAWRDRWDRRARNCFEDARIAIVQNGTDGTELIAEHAALDASGNPSQTTHNVKITFINFDFLKINKCK